MSTPEIEARLFNRAHYSQDAHLSISKLMIRNLGLVPAVFLSDLLSKESYFESHNSLQDGYFFNTEENRKWDSGLTPHQQRKGIKKLSKLEILEVVRKGIPARQWFRINHLNLKNQLLKFKELDIKILRTINKNKEIRIRNKSILKNTKGFSDENPNMEIVSPEINFDKGYIESFPSIKSNQNILPESNPIGFISPAEKLKQKQQSEFQDKKKPVPKIQKEIMQEPWKKVCLNTWNELPNVTCHKNLNTKTMQQIDKALNDLIQGRFFQTRHFKDECLKKLKITRQTKISERQIASAIRKYEFYLTDGYWPVDKSKLPKDLLTFIYNPRTGKSFLLHTMYNEEPKPLAENNKKKDWNPQYTEQFKKHGLLDKIGPENMDKVYKAISSIEWRVLNEWLFDFKDKSVREKLGERKQGRLTGLFSEYAYYVRHEWNDRDSQQVFNPYGKHFKSFIKDFNGDPDWED